MHTMYVPDLDDGYNNGKRHLTANQLIWNEMLDEVWRLIDVCGCVKHLVRNLFGVDVVRLIRIQRFRNLTSWNGCWEKGKELKKIFLQFFSFLITQTVFLSLHSEKAPPIISPPYSWRLIPFSMQVNSLPFK